MELSEWVFNELVEQIRQTRSRGENVHIEHGPKPNNVMNGADLIKKERQNHFLRDGRTNEQDLKWGAGELAYAGAAYAIAAGVLCNPRNGPPLTHAAAWWPGGFGKIKIKDRLSNLIRAGALIAAEIDRLQSMGLTIGEEPVNSAELDPAFDVNRMPVPPDPADPVAWPAPTGAFGITQTTVTNPPTVFQMDEDGLREVRRIDEQLRNQVGREILTGGTINPAWEAATHGIVTGPMAVPLDQTMRAMTATEIAQAERDRALNTIVGDQGPVEAHLPDPEANDPIDDRQPPDPNDAIF